MGRTETLLVYLLLGLVFAVGLALRERRGNLSARLILFLGTLFFWPVLAPFVLHSSPAPPADLRDSTGPEPLQRRVGAADRALAAALGRLGGVAESILAPERERLRGLGAALSAMARRIAEMDRLLASAELDPLRARARLLELEGAGRAGDDPQKQSLEARLRNIERLQAMRARSAEDLERALCKMEEMASQLVLLQFAAAGAEGSPAGGGRAEAEVVSRIREIAATIEGAAEGLIEAA